MKCKYCGAESDQFETCPVCGFPMHAQEENVLETQSTTEDHTVPAYYRKPFGAGKTLVVIFSSIAAGLFIVFLTCSFLTRINFLGLNEIDHAAGIYELFDHPANPWENSFGEWY